MASEHGVSHAPCHHQTTDGSRSWTNCRNTPAFGLLVWRCSGPVSLPHLAFWDEPEMVSPRRIFQRHSTISTTPAASECQQRQNGSAVPPFSGILLPGLGVVWVGTYLPLQRVRCSVTHSQNKAARGPTSQLFQFAHLAAVPGDSGPNQRPSACRLLDGTPDAGPHSLATGTAPGGAPVRKDCC